VSKKLHVGSRVSIIGPRREDFAVPEGRVVGMDQKFVAVKIKDAGRKIFRKEHVVPITARRHLK
jgi:hypothetical protein